MLKSPIEKPDVGQTIKWNEKDWLVVAQDATSSNNTSFPHWDYMLRRADSSATYIGAVKVIAIRDSDHPDLILDFELVQGEF